MTERGKFVVIYGAPNLGKSVQIPILVERLNEAGFRTSGLKYPIYELEPTGPRLDAIFRKNAEPNLSPAMRQAIFADNRRDYQPKLIERLNRGEWIVAEDYVGTGIAWGLTYGVSRSLLDQLNKDLLVEDMGILLDGEERFSSGIERGHLHEESGEWERNRDIHRMLASKFGWGIVDANQLRAEVANDVWKVVESKLLK